MDLLGKQPLPPAQDSLVNLELGPYQYLWARFE